MTPAARNVSSVIGAIMLVVVGATCWTLVIRALQIRQLDVRYRQIQRGMDTNTVVRIMGPDPEWHREPLVGAWWDQAALSASEAARIHRAARYTVPAFLLPVTFEFTFDENGVIVGRHRYD